MRKLLTLSVAACLLLEFTAAVSAQEAGGQPDQARRLVQQAKRAHGGGMALRKARSLTWAEKGTYYGMGDGLPYTGQYAAEWPQRFKMDITDVFTVVHDGRQAWMKTPAGVMEVTGDDLKELQEQRHAGYVTTLLFPLREESPFKLAAAGDADVNGKPAAGVKVSREGFRDVTLYFDKESKRLAKAQYKAKYQEQGGEIVDEEVFYNEFREVDGVQFPSKMTINRGGEKFVEAEIHDVKFVEEHAAGTFGKPE